MNPLADWLQGLLLTGESVQREKPHLTKTQQPQVLQLLNVHFDAMILELAGPPLPFVADLALQTAQVLAESCWLVASAQTEPPHFRLPPPRSAADHATADVCLQSLHVLFRRAVARGRDSPLSLYLETLLRQWPLSGVLAGLNEPPTSFLEFDDHPGLQLLYAERLAERPNPHWMPSDGRTRQHVERVFDQLRLPLPVLPQLQPEGVV